MLCSVKGMLKWSLSNVKVMSRKCQSYGKVLSM